MKNTTITILTGIVILIIILMSLAGMFITEREKKPLLKEKIDQNKLNYLYDYYVVGKPVTTQRPYYGNENASIDFILYTDIRSTGAQSFVSTILPQLTEEFINPGYAKLFIKHHITIDDVTQKTEEYYLAQSMACMREQEPKAYFSFFLALFNTTITDVPELAASMGANRTTFVNCVKQQTFKSLEEDVAEVEQFGMIGISPRLYLSIRGVSSDIVDGVPSYDTLRRRVRNLQILIGE